MIFMVAHWLLNYLRPIETVPYLIHIQSPAVDVEPGVQVVQHVDDLHGRAGRAYRREAHDVREQHGHILYPGTRRRS